MKINANHPKKVTALSLPNLIAIHLRISLKNTKSKSVANQWNK